MNKLIQPRFRTPKWIQHARYTPERLQSTPRIHFRPASDHSKPLGPQQQQNQNSTQASNPTTTITKFTTPRRRPKRVIIAITGATGAPLAISLLQHLRTLPLIETHLIISTWGLSTLKYEVPPPHNTASYLCSLAHHSYSPKDVSASLSSGSFRTHAMIVVPCSMKTLAGIRMGYEGDLISRAAGVTLKERRRLVLVARETPLSAVHLENMLEVTRAGAVVFPPVMAFYTRPSGIQEMVEQSVGRMVDSLDLGEEGEVVLEEEEMGEAGEGHGKSEKGRWTGFEWGRKRRGSEDGV